MNEQWRDVPGWEGRYRVSDQGRVLSLSWRNTGKARVLDPRRPSASGYPCVNLAGVPVPIHGLVLAAFVGPRPSGMEACHANDDKRDNRLSNLRWGTRRENMADAERNGIRQRADRKRSRLLPDQVVVVRSLLAAGCSAREVAAKFSVSRGCILGIEQGRTWKWLKEGQPA